MQKLVTIYLDNLAYFRGVTTGYKQLRERHGVVEEHLESYLTDGWRVSSVAGFGGNSGQTTVRGWVVVLLEKE